MSFLSWATTSLKSIIGVKAFVCQCGAVESLKLGSDGRLVCKECGSVYEEDGTVVGTDPSSVDWNRHL